MQKHTSEYKQLNWKSKYYLQIADNALIHSLRLKELAGFNNAFLLSLSQSDYTIQLNKIAKSIYQEVRSICENEGENFVVIRENPEDYYNAILFELENEDEYFVIVRQYFTDVFHALYFEALANSKDVFLSVLGKENKAFFANQVTKSRLWFKELKFSDEQMCSKIQKNIDLLWDYSADFFQASTVDLIMISRETGVDLHKIERQWKAEVEKAIREESFQLPHKKGNVIGGKEGRHSRSFYSLLKKLQTEAAF